VKETVSDEARVDQWGVRATDKMHNSLLICSAPHTIVQYVSYYVTVPHTCNATLIMTHIHKDLNIFEPSDTFEKAFDSTHLLDHLSKLGVLREQLVDG